MAFPSFRLSALLLAGCAATALNARAQTIDYGMLEQMVGEPITASATGKPQRASQAPVSMDIITAEQIRRSGAHDIPGVLMRYTTLDVAQYNAHDASVAVRGMNTPMSPRLLVLVDGRQVYLDDYGRTAWHLIPVQLGEIRQIEVVKGPNSALFGFNATAGVINIITFNPAYDRVNTGTLRIGSDHYREATAVATAPLGEGSGVRLSAGIRQEDSWSRGYTTAELAREADREPTRYQLASTGLFRVAEGVQIGFDANYSRSEAGEFVVGGGVTPMDQRAWSLRGRMVADTSYGLIDGSVYHNGLRTIGSGNLVLDQGVTVMQLSDTLKIGAAHTLRPSLEYRHNSYEMSTGTRVSYDVASAGLMWNWAISDSVETTLAGRWDQLWLDGSGYQAVATLPGDAAYERDLGTFAYNAGVVWKATEADTFRLSAARGIGSPSLVDFGFTLRQPGFAYVGNPALNPTVVDNYEAGWTRRIAAIEGQVGVTGFYQLNHDLTSSPITAPRRVTPGFGLTSTALNAGQTHVYGFELSANGRLPRGFDWGLGYRYAQVDGEIAAGVTMPYINGSPLQIATARLGWGDGPYRLDGFTRYATQSSTWRNRGTSVALVTTSDQVWAGLRAAYRPAPQLEFALEADGVISETEDARLALEPERRVYLSVRVDF